MTKHYAAIHWLRHTEQPQGQQMGSIVNQFKKKITSKPQSIQEIIAACSVGQCIVPANYAVDLNDNYKMGFISSSLIFIDVDDDFKLTNPHTILAQLPHCTGLFYTFSHGKKGNRYRLIFQLSQPIHNFDIYKTMVEIIGREVDALISYPEWYYKPFKDERTGKLITRDPIVDTKPKSALLPIRTGIMQPIISDLHTTVDTAKYNELARRELLERAEARKATYEGEIRFKLSFEELKEMAEKIGYIPSGTGEKDTWSRLIMALKHYANTGAITQEEGEQLFEIISGGEPAPNAWSKLNPSGAATIGSFVKEAQNRGYKRNPHRFGLRETVHEVYPVQNVKVKRYIPTDLAKEWLASNKKVLIESPTGSGKSTALIKASLELAKERQYSFYIFSAPTRPLAKQLAQKHNLMLVRGAEKDLYKQVFNAYKSGTRVFVATYDLTNTLMEWIKQMQPHAAFHVIIDEFHKTVTDYSHSFRMNTLSDLQTAMEKAVSVVALSGTPDDILKSQFDEIIRVNNGQPASPCQEFAVYTYEKQKEALPMLIKLVESWVQQRKLLIYLNNTDVIAKLYDILRKRGIVTRTVSAAEKRNQTYKEMIEQEMIDDKVQVILATSVIADGISIQNSLEWECIVVSNHFSQLFNASLLKQMSNRFRNQYRRFSVFMQAPTNTEDKPFYIESAYTFLLAAANRFSKQINEEFNGQNMALFRASVLEKRYGLIESNEGVCSDKYFLRHEASQSKERYYASRRKAFIKAIEQILHMKNKGILSLDEVLNKPEQQAEIQEIASVISDLQAQHEKEREARKNNFSEVFTPNIYEAFLHDRDDQLKEVKPLINIEQYNCVKVLHKYASYDVCLHIAGQVSRNNESNKFIRAIDGLTDVLYFQTINRNLPTKRVFSDLQKLNDYYTKSDLEICYQQIAKAHRIKVSDVEAVAKKLFHFEQFRQNKARFYKLVPLTFETIASQFNLNVEDVKNTFATHLNYAKRTIRVALARFTAPQEKKQLHLQLV